MAINFPLSLPATPGFARSELAMRSVTGRTESPFSLAEQTQEWNERWEAGCTLPPIKDRATLGQWEAILLSLRGGAGTFLMGDPKNASPMGVGAAASAVPTVSLAQLAGAKTLATAMWGNSAAVLKPGDILQLAKNYLTAPRAFDNAAWVVGELTKSGADAQLDPFGNPGAERLTPTVGATNASTHQNGSGFSGAVGGRPFSFSIYMKAASGTPSVNIFLVGLPSAAVRAQAVAALSASWSPTTLPFVVSGTMDAADTGVRVQVGGANTWVEADGAIDMWGASLWSTELDARLHKVVQPSDVVSSGGVPPAFDISPRLRAAVGDFSPLILANAVGTWRLAPGAIQRSLSAALIAGLGFEAVEAINL